ncbi:flagellar basal body P-ring formation chaperone FlgA [Malikia sp.]|uniref:flagellar basal body P-ring formation chaperone FlgA n=1 Tax=Malikia sp. TaxID=2070706 RepID=UPI0026313F72|nr:flagellar basal body P-ring formation chaperone FlgA [Malikia sp.]
MLLLLAACLMTPLGWTQIADKLHDHAQLMTQAGQFLANQFSPASDARIRVQPLDPQLRLPACPAPQFFLPAPAPALSGSMRVGMRCLSPKPWTVYANASVSEAKAHYVTKDPLQAGHQLQLEDLEARRAHSEDLPAGAISDPQQLLGRTLRQPLEAGTILRAVLIRDTLVISAGQTVKLIASGPGFSIHTEGRAMGNAMSGQRVQVRNGSGQIIQGVALPSGMVSVTP